MDYTDDAPPPTSAVLMSISKHIAIRCKKPNAAFIACKKEDRNPEACLSQGNAVTSCTIDVYALGCNHLHSALIARKRPALHSNFGRGHQFLPCSFPRAACHGSRA